MKRYIIELVQGGASLLAGLGVTLRALVAQPVTVPYPRKKLPMQPGFRGHPMLVRNPATGAFTCIACGTCMQRCPSRCIDITAARTESGTKYPARFQLDFTRCSLCGICVEVCPVSGLAFSRSFAMPHRTREACKYDLVTRGEEGT
ncbi:MAG: 4Fe-4S binding protein [Desulfobacterota bacterium]|nr:4Fe-4S binding protein [Thermodesulfobacteriota bacterium]